MEVIASETIMSVSEEQPQKTQSLTVVTVFGIVSLIRLLQLEKALFPIEITESGILMLVSWVQFLKARAPIAVMESGKMIVLKDDFPKNESFGILLAG